MYRRRRAKNAAGSYASCSKPKRIVTTSTRFRLSVIFPPVGLSARTCEKHSSMLLERIQAASLRFAGAVGVVLPDRAQLLLPTTTVSVAALSKVRTVDLA